MTKLQRHTRRIVLFRRLGPGELRISRMMRSLGLDVRYIEPIGALRNESAVAELGDRGIVWLKPSELPDLDAFAPIDASHRLSISLIDRLFPPRVLDEVARLLPAPACEPRRARILLYELVRGYLTPHGLAVSVAAILQRQGHRVWLWQPNAPLLGLARPGVRNLCPSLLSTPSRLLDKLAARVQRRSSGALDSGTLPPAGAKRTVTGRVTPDAAEVLFFPHQGPFYGDLFAKDHYYSADPTNPLHRSQVLHVELIDEVPPAVRPEIADTYMQAGLAFQWLPSRGTTRVPPRELLRLSRRIGPAAAAIALMLRERLLASIEQLRAFPRAHLALLGYESLFPRLMAVALQARGIAVVATQERFVQPFHPGFHLVLDRYLVHGPRIAEVVRNNPLCSFGVIDVTGDVRLPHRSSIRRPGPHRCLVLDFHSLPNAFSDALAIASGWASNRIFLEDILRLSEEFPDVHFTIRGKDTRWVELPVFADLLERVTARPNLAVDRERSLDRSYVLLADSDSVVARHTSLGDQALALGMPVLFHERMATGVGCISPVLDYSPFPLLTRSYEELSAAFQRVLRTGHVLSPTAVAELRRTYYAQPSELHPRDVAGRILSGMLDDRPASVAV